MQPRELCCCRRRSPCLRPAVRRVGASALSGVAPLPATPLFKRLTPTSPRTRRGRIKRRVPFLVSGRRAAEYVRQKFPDARAARQAHPHWSGLGRDVDSKIQKRATLALEGDPFSELRQRHALRRDLHLDSIWQLALAYRSRGEHSPQLVVARTIGRRYGIEPTCDRRLGDFNIDASDRPHEFIL